MTEQEIQEVLRKHELWLGYSSQQDAMRANLCGANLYGANLYGADLCGAKNIPFVPYVCQDFGR